MPVAGNAGKLLPILFIQKYRDYSIAAGLLGAEFLVFRGRAAHYQENPEENRQFAQKPDGNQCDLPGNCDLYDVPVDYEVQPRVFQLLEAFG